MINLHDVEEETLCYDVTFSTPESDCSQLVRLTHQESVALTKILSDSTKYNEWEIKKYSPELAFTLADFIQAYEP